MRIYGVNTVYVRIWCLPDNLLIRRQLAAKHSVFGCHLSLDSLPKCSLMFQEGSTFIMHFSLMM